jgi:hypothetical protein
MPSNAGHGRGPVSPRAFYNARQYIQVIVSGYTRNSAGTILPGCAVHLFRTSDDLEMDQTTSDTNGYYEFRTAIPAESYYAVAYLAGAPDVAGTTVNTLVGT